MQSFCERHNLKPCHCGGDPRLNWEGPFVWIACERHPHKHKTREFRGEDAAERAVSAWREKTEPKEATS